VSHTRTVPSSPAEAKRDPSELKATIQIKPVSGISCSDDAPPVSGISLQWLLRLVHCGPLDPVLLVRRDVDEIARLQLYNPMLKAKSSSAFQNNHPLVLVLIVPAPFGRCMAVRDDPLSADTGSFE
jgi:hypothetical protein